MGNLDRKDMKRLVIIVEGETEEAFVNQLLMPYIWHCGYTNSIQCFKLKHSGGGVSKYNHIKNDLLNTLHEHAVIVTTMFDYYGLPTDTPAYKETTNVNDHLERVKQIEVSIQKDVLSEMNNNDNILIPYIQLHEIEALAFSSTKGFTELFDKREADLKTLADIIEANPNPEDINNNPNTAPSKRLLKAIPGYDKVLYGVGIMECIGMETIISKCPHFREWIGKLKVHLTKG